MFLLTGSASAVALPQLYDALVGRMFITALSPLSQGEFAETKEDFFYYLFETEWKTKPDNDKDDQADSTLDLCQRIVRGGYPAPALMSNATQRKHWFGSYITSVIHQDIRQIADIERLSTLPNLLTLAATRTGGLLNVSDLGSAMSLPGNTLSRYLSLLDAVYLTYRLRPWSLNIAGTITKSPKLYLQDTGLASYLLNLTADKLAEDRQLFGRMLENFVLCELLKQRSWSDIDTELFHFRTHQGIEVDFIVKARDGRLVPIEVKSASQIKLNDFRGIDYFASHFPKEYHRGVIFYCGKPLISFGNKRWAVPVQMLWQSHFKAKLKK